MPRTITLIVGALILAATSLGAQRMNITSTVARTCVAVALATSAALTWSCARTPDHHSTATTAERLTTVTTEDLRRVAPALARYQDTTVLGDLWNRPALSRRDRSLVTVAAVIARNQAAEMPSQFERALDHGLTASELSEVITHLAFYAGWGNAMSAVSAARDVSR